VPAGVIGNELSNVQLGRIQKALAVRRQRAPTLVEEDRLLQIERPILQFFNDRLQLGHSGFKRQVFERLHDAAPPSKMGKSTNQQITKSMELEMVLVSDSATDNYSPVLFIV
jgi:hypothetical protein